MDSFIRPSISPLALLNGESIIKAQTSAAIYFIYFSNPPLASIAHTEPTTEVIISVKKYPFNLRASCFYEYCDSDKANRARAANKCQKHVENTTEIVKKRAFALTTESF